MPKKTEYAENGQTPNPKGEIAEMLNAVNAWAMPEFADDDEAEQRLSEFFNLCVLKNELPMFETMCLYLGISDDRGKEIANGENCSGRLTRLFKSALTKVKAVEGKAVNAGKLRDVPYIWRSKQYFGYREPTSKLEDMLAGSLLRELPTSANIAKRYLEDAEDVD